MIEQMFLVYIRALELLEGNASRGKVKILQRKSGLNGVPLFQLLDMSAHTKFWLPCAEVLANKVFEQCVRWYSDELLHIKDAFEVAPDYTPGPPLWDVESFDWIELQLKRVPIND